MNHLGIRVLRPQETAAKVGLCDSQLRLLETDGLFPKRFPLSLTGKGRAVGHLESEVEAWIEERASSGRPLPSGERVRSRQEIRDRAVTARANRGEKQSETRIADALDGICERLGEISSLLARLAGDRT